MFKFENFVDKLKEKNINLKTIVLGSVLTAILATSVISNVQGKNTFLRLQTLGSQYSSYDINVDVNDRLKDYNLENFNVSFKSTKLYKNIKLHSMYVSSIDNTKKEVNIKEVGRFFDLFTDSINISQDKQKNDLFNSLSIITKLGFASEIKLTNPDNLEKFISVDVENFHSPSITYLDNKGFIHYDTISRHDILRNAKSVYLTEEQFQKLSVEEQKSVGKVDNKEGLDYNGRILSRFGGDTQTFVLPKDFKEIISISKDGMDKIITYKSIDGSLNISVFNDLNLNTSYKLIDNSSKNFYNQNTETDVKNINIGLINKLSDDNNSKIHILKTNIDKNNVNKILNVDSNGGSYTVTYEDKNGVIQTQDVGKTFGIFEGKTIFSGIKIKSDLKTNITQTRQLN